MANNHKSKRIIVLGIETSCDDTAAAIYDTRNGLLAHTISNQNALHSPYGGVVPELASRDHLAHTIPCIAALLRETQLTMADLHAIAYTKGPGLAGALLVGATIGRTLAWANNIPAIAVHHLEGHLLAVMLENPAPALPFLALLVSGGHTMLVHAQGLGVYKILGDTRDDAVGEAFDKTAKLLGLGYPGGAALAKLAARGTASFKLPQPLLTKNTIKLDFSFSGLKTAVSRTIASQTVAGKLPEKARADIARSFESTVVATLVAKCKQALLATKSPRLVIAGGVAANEALRAAMLTMAQTMGVSVYIPRPEFCTDNGAMIAYAGCQRFLAGQQGEPLAIAIKPRWPLTEIANPSCK
jgi:N6-L-threonylcarbamoyladenine synthase